jgi:hypothetical protein
LRFSTSLRERALFACLLLSGCNQILGIQVQKADDGGTTEDDAGQDGGEIVYESPSEDDCQEYCDVINSTCKAGTSKAAFANESYCSTLCPHMQRTADRLDDGNTFDCRLKLVKAAAQIAPDNASECRAVGAGGEDMCGSSCQGYCQLFESVCGEFEGLSRGETCLSECEKLPVDRARDATAAFGSMSDTLQCRLAHLGAASSSPDVAETHCTHAAISVTTTYTPCVTDTPRCEDFCTLIDKTCTGKMQMYETYQDCVAICKNGLTLKAPMLNADEPIDISRDTVACRRYHTYNALKTPSGVHCEHGGPTGDGHCGKICPAYCQLAKAACSADYAKRYMNDDACKQDCDTQLQAEGVTDQIDHHYSVSKGKAADAAPMQCRVYHVSKAFLAPSANCAAALGLDGSPCAK